MKKSRKEYHREWHILHDHYSRDKSRERRKTPIGRAEHLISDYKIQDKNKGFDDEIDFDAQWIVENILSKPCAHCGKIGWQIIGCNRLDNDKPHTKENVEPCCRSCNSKLAGHPKVKVAQIDPNTKEVIKIYESCKEARKNGFYHVSDCCNGKIKLDKGFIFKKINDLCQ